jgi:heat shock protein HslJ
MPSLHVWQVELERSRFMLTRGIHLLLLTGLLLTSCSTANPTTTAPGDTTPRLEPELVGTVWVLQALGLQDEPQVALSGVQVTASFDTDTGTVSGQTGCNDFTAIFSVDADQITIGPVGATLKACGEILGMQQMEMVFVNILENAATYQISENQLTILTGDGRVLIFTHP